MKRTVATKTSWHRPDPSGHGVVETDVPTDLQDRPSVSDDEIAELVAVARTVEAHYGCPQDIEWAVAEGGERVPAAEPAGDGVGGQGRGGRPRRQRRRPPFDHVFNLLGGKRPSGS